MQTDNPYMDPKLIAKRLERYIDLTEVCAELGMAGIKYRHPEATPVEVRKLFIDRLNYFRNLKWQGIASNIAKCITQREPPNMNPFNDPAK